VRRQFTRSSRAGAAQQQYVQLPIAFVGGVEPLGVQVEPVELRAWLKADHLLRLAKERQDGEPRRLGDEEASSADGDAARVLEPTWARALAADEPRMRPVVPERLHAVVVALDHVERVGRACDAQRVAQTAGLRAAPAKGVDETERRRA